MSKDKKPVRRFGHRAGLHRTPPAERGEPPLPPEPEHNPVVKAAILETVNTLRSNLGAYTNRIEHAINNIINEESNSQEAESIIRDTDFASETAKFTKNQMLTQSATAMLAEPDFEP